MNELLQRVSSEELRTLIADLRGGRLYSPFSVAALQRYVAPTVAEGLAAKFQQLSDEGLQTSHLATMLELVRDERENKAPLLDLLDLVTTGPDAAGSTTRDTAAVVHEMFVSARQSILIVGYAVYQGRYVFGALADRMDRSVDLAVDMYLDVQRGHGETSLASEIVARFANRFRKEQWPGKRLPRVYYDPRSVESNSKKRTSLHAKCVVIDGERLFVSSANFTEAAQERNVEVGLLIRSPEAAQRVVQHFQALTAARMMLPIEFRS